MPSLLSLGGTIPLQASAGGAAGSEPLISGSSPPGANGTAPRTPGSGGTLLDPGGLTRSGSGRIVFDDSVIDPARLTNEPANPLLASSAVDAAAAGITVSCFAAGTGIATTRGLVPVERVRPGDRVCTVLTADTAEVIWVGRREVDCTRHPDPVKVWPIRVAAHAFGRGMPAADLVLSPEHAVFVDRVLIPIRLLVNGRSVRRTPVDHVSYYHVELAEHDVLVANGMPAETYLDTGDRSRFSNGGEVIALHPDFSARTWEMRGCAPLVQTGPVLTAVRKRLVAEVVRRRRRARETVSPETGWPL